MGSNQNVMCCRHHIVESWGFKWACNWCSLKSLDLWTPTCTWLVGPPHKPQKYSEDRWVVFCHIVPFVNSELCFSCFGTGPLWTVHWLEGTALQFVKRHHRCDVQRYSRACLFQIWRRLHSVNVKRVVEIILVKDSLWHKMASDFYSYCRSGLLTAVTKSILGWTETFTHSCPNCHLSQTQIQGNILTIWNGQRFIGRFNLWSQWQLHLCIILLMNAHTVANIADSQVFNYCYSGYNRAFRVCYPTVSRRNIMQSAYCGMPCVPAMPGTVYRQMEELLWNLWTHKPQEHKL